MNRKRLMFVPLVLFVAFSMVVMPVLADDGMYPIVVKSDGVGKVKNTGGWFSSYKGYAEFAYCFYGEAAILEIVDQCKVFYSFDHTTMKNPIGDMYTLCADYECSCCEPSARPYDIRIVVIAEECSDHGMVLVYGRGARYVGLADKICWAPCCLDLE